MRRSILPAMLAALSLTAAPAAAQPDAPGLLRAALEQLSAGRAPDVRDYTFSLVHGSIRTPVYVYREGTGWVVRMPDTPLADVLEMAVFWPEFGTLSGDPVQVQALDDTEYLRDETVRGRRTHVLSAALGTDAQLEHLDSARVYVDAETRQVARMMVAAPLPPEMGQEVFGEGGTMIVTLDAEGYRAVEGVLLPGHVRVRMLLQLPGMTAEARDGLLAEIGGMREALREEDAPEAAGMVATLDAYLQMLSAEGMDVRVAVEDVRVNPGEPWWVDEPDF